MTGGGTAGHVIPNIAIIEKLQKEEFSIGYIGSINGIEKELITNINIPYYAINSGKLRRYLSLENIKDVFRIIKGIGEAKKILNELNPAVVFSKGGFVSVPVVIAAKSLNIPIIIHESDFTIGLANRIAIPFATYVCCSFPETLKKIKDKKGFLTDIPLKSSLFKGDKNKGYKLTGFTGKKPILFVFGGSQGAKAINDCLKNSLDELLKKFDIVHGTGKNNIDTSINKKGYKQFEYIDEEFANILSIADIVVSRAGANSIAELVALKKPNLLIPLSKKASRGDQILNAESFRKQGFSKVLLEENLNKTTLINNINELLEQKDEYINNMSKRDMSDGVLEVKKLIDKIVIK